MNRQAQLRQARAQADATPEWLRTPRDKRERYVLIKYGLLPAEYIELEESQNGLCAICQLPQSDPYSWLCVDHCHATGKVRGLLCDRCNHAIGFLRDDITIAKSLADYLKKHASKLVACQLAETARNKD